MGSYGIGMGRLLSAIVEANHDERGISWPPGLAPFLVYLMGIGKSQSVRRTVESLYEKLSGMTLLDDRLESPGVKFTDCEMIGIPLRIVVSARLLESGKTELYERETNETREIDVEAVPGIIDRYRERGGLDE
jgi:prolyl-tRNA synthetase